MAMLEIIGAILAGCTAGIVTGLIPGIHINLISLMLLNASAFLLTLTDNLTLASFIIAMSITHTFLDSIPSIFLGAPDSAMALGVLPGHKMLLEGRGYEAVKLTVIGSFGCLILATIFIPILIPVLPFLAEKVTPYIGQILLIVVLFMLLKDWDMTKISWNVFLFILSGTLGIIVLNYPNLNQPLFPMLSGLFGTSALILSLSTNTKIPDQRITHDINVPRKEKIKALSAATFSGILTGFFPGLGAAQAAIIAMQLVGEISVHAFMILIGGINTVNFLFSIATFYALDKARNGAIIVVQELVPEITIQQVAILISVALISASIATILALNFAKLFSKLINKINYKKMCYTVITLIAVLVTYFSGILGLYILIISTLVGMVAPLAHINRSHAMGCLLLPVILFFLL